MARALRRGLAATALSVTILAIGVPVAHAAPPAPAGCREIREPITGMWWIIC